MTASNTYFVANGLFTFDMVRQLSLVDHSLIADAFCPVVQQIEKDIAAGVLPRFVPEVAAYYGPLLTNCKRRAARAHQNVAAEDGDQAGLGAGVGSGQQWTNEGHADDGSGVGRFDPPSRPEFEQEALNDPWAVK